MRLHGLFLCGLSLSLGLIGLTACGTVYPEAKSVMNISSDEVILVGRIDLIPPLRSGEQQIRLGTIDPFGAGDIMRDRVMLFLADRPGPAEPTRRAINPRLGELFFFQIPKNVVHVVYATIYTKRVTRMTGRRSVQEDITEIVLPRMQFDIRGTDRAIYIGTVKLKRDEFNSVIGVGVLDEIEAASLALSARFGSALTLRKSLAMLEQQS